MLAGVAGLLHANTRDSQQICLHATGNVDTPVKYSWLAAEMESRAVLERLAKAPTQVLLADVVVVVAVVAAAAAAAIVAAVAVA